MQERKLLFRDEYDYKKVIEEDDDFIYAHGGDGTLLKAIFMFSDKNKPFYGSAGGTLNFLMNTETTPKMGAKIKTFRKIKATILYKTWQRDMAGLDDVLKPVQKEFQAFNDICIGGIDGMNAFINFNVKEKDDIFGDITGGGLIISTPQGSTGINRTNGGVVLPLSSNNWSITGDKTTRLIDYVVKPHRIQIIPSSRKSVMVWIDGANKIIDNVDKIILEKGDAVQVVFNNYSEFRKKRRI